MRLPTSAHAAQPWRIHEYAGDYAVEDVWALPTLGGEHDFVRLLDLFTSREFRARTPALVRALFAIRWELGRLMRWDESHESTDPLPLQRRLPPDLAATARDSTRLGPFRTLYALDNEWAAELVNRTIDGVLHLGWVPDGEGRYRGQLAVLVRRNGLLGMAYMATIAPFRYAVVYPLMTRQLGRAWGEIATHR